RARRNTSTRGSRAARFRPSGQLRRAPQFFFGTKRALAVDRVARRSGESFDSPGRSEPDLASPLRCGTGAYSGRFRPAGRTAIASGIARLSRGPIHGNELVVQTDDSRDCLEPRLSDEFGTSRQRVSRGPRESPVVAHESPPAGHR